MDLTVVHETLACNLFLFLQNSFAERFGDLEKGTEVSVFVPGNRGLMKNRE
jgi:hypothetical protein